MGTSTARNRDGDYYSKEEGWGLVQQGIGMGTTTARKRGRGVD